MPRVASYYTHTQHQQEGQTVALKDFKGQHVAIYFYNKDDTPVVNRGGAAFAKAFGEFEKLGVPLLFIGPDRCGGRGCFVMVD